MSSGRGNRNDDEEGPLNHERVSRMAVRHQLSRRLPAGFTLIEMMVTIVVMSILATIAIPNFTRMVRSNRMSSEANSLLTTLTLARGEAIKRSSRVTLCKSSDGANCSTASNVNWNQGIIVFVDTNSNGAIDTGEVVIRADSPFSKLDTITFSNGNTVVYQANGTASSSAGTFTVTSGTSTKTIDLNAVGRARIL